MKKLLVCFLIAIAFGSLCTAAYCAEGTAPIYVIGQDVQSIDDFMAALKNQAPFAANIYPQGIMVYTAINDMRGLWGPVDQGAGVNDADQSLKEYPQMQMVQVGLFIRYMLNEIVHGSFDNNIDQLGKWIKN